jgi:TolB-like protein/DNA-binding winged helix-turn-helix (wHTH) protein
LAEPTTSGPRPIHFGVFQVNLHTGELRKNGSKIKLEGQPFQILALLLDRPGELVTREELEQKLWAPGTFVDFEHSINAAVKRLREVLGDSADSPHFIETLPRRGYRFIYPLEGTGPMQAVVPPAPWWRRHWAAGLLLIVVVGAGASASLKVARLRNSSIRPPTPQLFQSIAVLPMRNLSGDPTQDYFADGMTEALITELGKTSALRVISLQSVLRYKGSRKPISDIARELNVDAVIEGSVLRSGDQVRIDAQLVQAEPERHLWSETFERNMRDVLALQSDVSRGIAREIQVSITPEQRVLLSRSYSVNPEAYHAWLRGRQLYSRYSDEWFDSAIAYLQKAIRLDPTYAPPYATLASVYCTDMRSSYDALYPLAASATSKALDLDGTLAEAHAAQGLVNLRFRWDWAGAEREFERAIQINPNSAEAHANYGYFLTLMGRFDEGIAAYRRAVEVDPLNFLPNQRLTWALDKAGRHDEAIVRLLELKRLEPDAYMVAYGLAHSYAHKKMYHEALAEINRVKCINFDCGWVLAVSGRRKEARELINRLIRLSKRQYIDPVFIALTYAGLGENNKALEWLEMGYRMRSRWMIYLKVVKELDPLRPDPRFQDLLHRMNFPPQETK